MCSSRDKWQQIFTDSLNLSRTFLLILNVNVILLRMTFAVDPDTHIDTVEQAKASTIEGTSKWSCKLSITGTKRIFVSNLTNLIFLNEMSKKQTFSSNKKHQITIIHDFSLLIKNIKLNFSIFECKPIGEPCKEIALRKTLRIEVASFKVFYETNSFLDPFTFLQQLSFSLLYLNLLGLTLLFVRLSKKYRRLYALYLCIFFFPLELFTSFTKKNFPQPDKRLIVRWWDFNLNIWVHFTRIECWNSIHFKPEAAARKAPLSFAQISNQIQLGPLFRCATINDVDLRLSFCLVFE